VTDVKKCPTCREIKSVSEFTARRDGSGKYAPRCNECERAKQVKKRNEAQERQRERQRNKPRTEMKRTTLKPMSDKRKLVNQQRREAMLEAFGPREKWVCMGQNKMPHKCFGGINGHEIKSRSRAGRTDENLLDMTGIITICDWLNGWIEDYPREAHALGLAKHAWE